MIVDIDSDNPNEVFCSRKRCSRFLFDIVEQGQAIEIGYGNVRIWHAAILTCRHCNKPYRWEPKSLGKDLIDTDTLEKEFNF